MLLPSAVAGAVLLVAQARPSADSILLRVLATNDFHGSLEARVQAWSNHRPVGGAAELAGMMDRLARACGCATIRLDGGDVMQGSPVSNLTWGRATVDAFNAMGYAAAAVGNHEFDWGVDTLAARVRDAHFVWLSANLRERDGGRAPPWATPWQMVTRLIPDEQLLIEQTLKELVDNARCHLVLTTGGTGPAPRDVTPEATLAVAHKVLPGFGEQMRQVSLKYVPTAILSRQVGAIRGRSLILNLPGQPKAIKETLDGVFPAVPYCLDLIGGPYVETHESVCKAFRPKSAQRAAGA